MCTRLQLCKIEPVDKMASPVARKVWEGLIPACFELANYEILSASTPDPYYTMLPRNSYLTLFTKEIVDSFSKFVDYDDDSQVWFEYREKPLRWHYPCGVLYDMYCDQGGTDLPWKITVHFKNFPEKELLDSSSSDVIEANYITMLKEADQLKHKGQVICNMSKNQHQQLWHGLKTNNFDEFWQINKKFMEGHEDALTFKSIPMRFYYNGKVFQKLIYPKVSDDSRESTLQDALHTVLPSLFENNILSSSITLIIQGITPSLTTSLQWLCEHLAYADNFLHVCVRS